MDKAPKVFLGILGFLVIAVGIRFGFTLANRPSDQQQIETAMKEAIQASREGRPGGVVDLLSRNLTVNDQQVNVERRMIADYVRSNRPEVEVLEPQAQITGTEGRIVSPVTLSLGPLSKTMKEVTLIFKKEPASEFGFIPTDKWRLVEVRVPDASLQDFMS